MTQKTLQRSPEEAAEIERHKYFLSENVGYDVGWEFAEEDWEANHAEDFRRTTIPNSTAPGAEGMGSRLMRLLAKARAR